MNNTFDINEIEYDCKIINDELEYKISGIVPSVREMSTGDTLYVTIKLSHFIKPDTYITLPVYIDESIQDGGALTIFCSGGRENLPIFKANPIDFKGCIDNLKQEYADNDIVIFYKTGSNKYINSGSVISGSAALTERKLFADNPENIKVPELIYSKFSQNFFVGGNTQVIIKLKK